jgi:hypothetical protein
MNVATLVTSRAGTKLTLFFIKPVLDVFEFSASVNAIKLFYSFTFMDG